MSKEINRKQLREIIRAYFSAKKPLYIKGATGIGKSYAVREEAQRLAAENKREFFEWNKTSSEEKHKFLENKELAGKSFIYADIRISQMDPSDLRGLPGLNGKDYVEWKHNLIFKVCSLPNIMGIVFFDEMNISCQSVQAAAYQIILDKCIGELALNENVCVIAAGNRAEDRANVFETSAPLNNRFGHYTLKKPTVEEFTDWGMENDVDDRILVFLNFKPSFLHKFDQDGADEAFPTHRSWTTTSGLIKELKDVKEIELLSAGQVGEGIAKEFASHIKMKDQIDLNALLKDPKKMAEIKEMDKIQSVVMGVVEKYRGDRKILDSIFQLTEFMQKEYAVLMIRLVKQSNKTNIKKDVEHCKTWPKVAKDFSKYMVD